MATFTAVKNRGGGRGALGGVMRYTQQHESDELILPPLAEA